MKHRNRAQSSSLFLLELILAILFFSLASAVCVQFFVKSHLLSRDARNLNCRDHKRFKWNSRRTELNPAGI